MKIPRSIKIGGKKIKVKLVDECDNAGEWDGNLYVISIENLADAPPERMEECLLHEIIEALNQLYELKLAHWKINIIGESLYQILKDNKLEFRKK